MTDIILTVGLIAQAVTLAVLVLKDVKAIPTLWLLLFAAWVGIDLVSAAHLLGLI